MRLYYLLPLISCWTLHVVGIALVLYTDRECKNQVGFLNGNYNGVCQGTLGTAAISFKVINPQSGCLVTLYPAANPPCPTSPNNFGFALIDKCYDNSNGSIAAYSVDLCDAPVAPPPSEKIVPSPSSSTNLPPPAPTTPPSEKTTPSPYSSSSSLPHETLAVSAPLIETTSTPTSSSTVSNQTPAVSQASRNTTLSPTSSTSLSSSLPTETPGLASPPPEGLTRAETITLAVVVPVLVAILSGVFTSWKKGWGPFKNKKSESPELQSRE